MSNVNIVVPYQVGAYLKRDQKLIKHVDQIIKYIIEQDDTYAILLLDALRDSAKQSIPIPISEFDGIWTLASKKDVEHEKGAQRILKTYNISINKK